MIFVRWTICSNLQLYIICRGDKRKDFKVTSPRLTSVNFSSHCRLPVLHSSNTMTISELFPHFEINACHPSCLIVLFFQYPAPPVSGTHYTTLILRDVGQHSWCVMKQSWNWTKFAPRPASDLFMRLETEPHGAVYTHTHVQTGNLGWNGQSVYASLGNICQNIHNRSQRSKRDALSNYSVQIKAFVKTKWKLSFCCQHYLDMKGVTVACKLQDAFLSF